MVSNSVISPALSNFDQADDLELPFAGSGGKFQRSVTRACDKAADRLFSARAMMEALPVRTDLR
jgi:hypothetical protein